MGLGYSGISKGIHQAKKAGTARKATATEAMYGQNKSFL